MTWCAVALVALLACGDDDAATSDGGVDGGADATSDASDASDASTTDAPMLNDLPALDELEDGWNELVPGGPTVCSRGSEFAFFVHPGTVNKLVVDFIGGGACWSFDTCAFATSIFSDSVEPVRDAIELGVAVGIYDRAHAENPFADWTHVIIPYCTGDIHWGDATTSYDNGTSEITIRHRGAANARVVLDWIYDNVLSPEQVFVTGCSAGSYGSIGWSAYLMEHYTDTPIVQFGDSGAGVITETFFRDSFPSWNAEAMLPDWLPGLDPGMVDVFELELADVYEVIGAAYPSNVVSQYNTTFDDNQTFYYEAMGGTGGAMGWSERMQASRDRIIASTPSYRAFQAPGEQHCIIVQENFYEVEANGVRLVEWLRDLVAGEDVENVICTDCDRPTPGT